MTEWIHIVIILYNLQWSLLFSVPFLHSLTTRGKSSSLYDGTCWRFVLWFFKTTAACRARGRIIKVADLFACASGQLRRNLYQQPPKQQVFPRGIGPEPQGRPSKTPCINCTSFGPHPKPILVLTPLAAPKSDMFDMALSSQLLGL